MKKSLIIFVFLLLIYFKFSVVPIFSDTEVFINEFNPTSNPEWVEFYNPNSLNLQTYFIDDDLDFDKDDKNSSKKELTDLVIDNPLYPFIKLNNFLNNDGDYVVLFNNERSVIDSYQFTSNPGDKVIGRIVDGTGNFELLSSSTKGSSNSIIALSPTPTPPAVPTPTQIIPPTPTPTNPAATLTPTPTPISYNNIYLSEFMAYPETDQNEWVELYNANNFTVYLASWYIDDIENAGSASKIFSKEIPALGYAVFELSSPVFNNDEDSVRLLDFNSALKDSFSYKDAVKGKTFGRVFPANDFCLQQPSKGTANTFCLGETPTASPTTSSAPTPTKTPTPEQISTIQPTIISDEKESSPSLFITQSDFLPFQKNSKPAEADNNVLGVKSNSAKKPVFHIKALSLTSFFISLLNILYILNKIRKINRF